MTRPPALTAFVLAAGGAGLLLGLLACGDDTAAPPPESPAPATTARAAAPAAEDPAAAASEAQHIFATRCTTCHGARGAGDGPGSAALTPKPRNLQDPAWQESVSDTHIEQIVLYGGAAVALSPAMPGNPDLNSKPAVVKELRKLIRALPAAPPE